MSSTILSTKVLSLAQKSLLLNAGLNVVEYDAITINFLDVEIPDANYDGLIFTSQNAVKGYLNKCKDSQKKNHQMTNVFCVGEKTKSVLMEEGFNVKVTTENARELGKIISANYKDHDFLWLTGNRRRNELPDVLGESNINYTEVTIYKTEMRLKKFDGIFDGILFFSPSGVTSFLEMNTLSGISFCIGNTTADSVKKYTDNYIVANKPTVENVLVQAAKRLRSND